MIRYIQAILKNGIQSVNIFSGRMPVIVFLVLLLFVVPFIGGKPEVKRMSEALALRIPDGSPGLIIDFGALFSSTVGAYHHAYFVSERIKSSKGESVKHERIGRILFSGALIV